MYDCTEDVKKHVVQVQRFVLEVINNLVRRSDIHDSSKLEEPEKSMYDEFTPLLRDLTYGSPEYKETLSKMGVALEHHYSLNSHHPEYAETQEIWKDVNGYEGHYQVSNYGQVRSVDRIVVRMYRGGFSKAGKIVKPYVTPKGYLRIQLSKDGKLKNFMVHRLVALAFIENPNNKPEVNHKDGNKRNNFLENLEWVTSSENQIHAYDTGLKKPNVKYIVKCIDLDIVTDGVEKMEKELWKRGYERASAATIWYCINSEHGKHLDLSFEGYPIEEFGEFSYINKMSLLDLVEMVSDWKAATMKHADGDIRKSLEINKERFGISDQLAKIIENTISEMGW